ncbi:MAG TPA: CZB domain-containing protein [Cellvibrio sp.]|nr:CZB domain-containing protein [Cellvibrio sp.]
MDLDSAIQKHSEWKMKFRTAISKKESLDAATIAKDNCCELGKWLHGEAKLKFSKLASHNECMTKHAAFHQEAGKVAALINAAKYSEAEAAIGSGTAYATVSSAVGVAIIKLKKEAGL